MNRRTSVITGLSAATALGALPAAAQDKDAPPANPELEKIRAVLKAHDDPMTNHNLDGVLAVLAPKAVVMGTGPGEIWSGPEELKDACSHFFADFDKGEQSFIYHVRMGELSAEMGWLFASGEVRGKKAGKEIAFPLNVSLTVSKATGDWKIAALHFSTLAGDEEAKWPAAFHPITTMSDESSNAEVPLSEPTEIQDRRNFLQGLASGPARPLARPLRAAGLPVRPTRRAGAGSTAGGDQPSKGDVDQSSWRRQLGQPIWWLDQPAGRLDQPSVMPATPGSHPAPGDPAGILAVSPAALAEHYGDGPLIAVVRTSEEFSRWLRNPPPGLEALQAEGLIGDPEPWALPAQGTVPIPIDVVLDDPSTEFSALYRLVDVRSVRDVRVTIPAKAGFLKAIRLAVSLQLPVRLLPGQPDTGTLAELSQALAF